MNLGVFLSLGESFADLKRTGQDQLMINQNISFFSKHFDKVYIFTYRQESVKLPKNCTLVTPPFKLHRYLYGILLPFIHSRIVRDLDINRCFQLSGTLPAIIAKVFFRKKFVFNLGYDYSTFAKIESKPIQANIFQLLQPIAIRMASKVIVKNKSLLRSLPRRQAGAINDLRSKYVYLPNGTNTQRFKPKKIPSNKISTILFVGRLEPQKNLVNLVRAIALLDIPVNLKMIGDGSIKHQLLSEAQKRNVTLDLTSKLKHSLMPGIYQRVDIFVLPSIKEGSPKVLLEAMSTGLACIVSDIPEHREIITHNKTGILTKASPRQLSNQLSNMLHSKNKRVKIGSAARNHIKAHFNANQLMAEEVKIIKNL